MGRGLRRSAEGSAKLDNRETDFSTRPVMKGDELCLVQNVEISAPSGARKY
jgi:hypothetical protein